VSWARWAERQGAAIEEAGRWRRPRTFDARGHAGVLCEDGRRVLSFASNDYLGLSSHPRVVEAAVEATRRWGAGCGSARLVVGSRPVHDDLEAELADWKGSEAVALFSSGYAANVGLLCALSDADTLVCSDELNHASIIDGCRLAPGRVAVYRHRDMEHLRSLLRGAGRTIVVSDSVFSMDGDLAPVEELLRICSSHGALLVLDEAHAVLGPGVEPSGRDVVRVGTLSKTLGSLGGFVAGPRRLVEIVVNTARPYVFSTALSPGDAGAALAALRIVRSQEGEALKATLAGHLGLLQSRLPGLATGSPIVPVLLGAEEDALAASRSLLDMGILVPAIRPPTVPPGSSRLRVTLSAAHSAEEVSRLASALKGLIERSALGA
jgi:8-amino-7-oxononanoate synthase